jgi:uncharacterized protein with GYD domain
MLIEHPQQEVPYAQVSLACFLHRGRFKRALKDGGSKRREAVEQAVKGLRGTLEAFSHAFGDSDVFAIADLPDNMSSIALSLIVNSTGMVTVKTTVLISPQEVDQAAKKSVNYRLPRR